MLVVANFAATDGYVQRRLEMLTTVAKNATVVNVNKNIRLARDGINYEKTYNTHYMELSSAFREC